ncbi:MAG: hypothetical protein AAF705_15165 [Bacteroidota bacterium]
MHQLKCWVVLVLVLSFCQCLVGQEAELYRPKLAIKYNPLAFLAYTPGIELGLERSISKEASIHLGGSYLNDFDNGSIQNFSGYKLIGEYRFYSPFSEEPNNSFAAFTFNFKKVIASGRTYVDRANGNYQELIDLTVDNTTLEFLASVGKVYPLNKWFGLDLAVVAGARRLGISSDDIPDDAFLSLSEDDFLNLIPNEPGNYWYPVFRLQVKLNFGWW